MHTQSHTSQENDWKSPDPFPSQRVGSQDETTCIHVPYKALPQKIGHNIISTIEVEFLSHLDIEDMGDALNSCA